MKIEDEIKQKKFRNETHKLLINLLFTGSWVTNLNMQFLKPFGITPQQYNILRILRGQHPSAATINLLQERMLDRMSNASRLVEKLRVKGLVERCVSKGDRRAVDVVITEKGLTLLKEIDVLDDEFDSKLRNVDHHETKMLNDLLDKLRG
jgi:DNA-binding MarR family transcriptional regulator